MANYKPLSLTTIRVLHSLAKLHARQGYCHINSSLYTWYHHKSEAWGIYAEAYSIEMNQKEMI